VAGADVISMFWDSMMCHTLFHELDCEQPYTTKELLDIATQHASGEEAVRLTFVLGNVKAATSGSRAAPSKATIKGAKKGAKGSKKGQKWSPWHISIAASNAFNDEKANDSGEEYVLNIEHNFKHQMWQSRDHFEKLLKATYPNHSYPVKNKLKDYTMMKFFMMLGAFSKGRKLEGDLGGKGTTPIPGEAEVMTIFD
jgi:hypothetical protein